MEDRRRKAMDHHRIYSEVEGHMTLSRDYKQDPPRIKKIQS